MIKRHKWTENQDKLLIGLLKNEDSKDINWEKISEKINNLKIKKSAKQCRERWYHQLDNNLNKGKWIENSLDIKRLP